MITNDTRIVERYDAVILDKGIYLLKEYPMLSHLDYNRWPDIGEFPYGICNSYHQVLNEYPEIQTSEREYITILCSCNNLDDYSIWGTLLFQNETELFHYHIFELRV